MELLNRIERRTYGRIKLNTVDLVVVIYSIEHNVGLVTAPAVYGPTARIEGSAHYIASQVDRSWLQRKNLRGIASFERQIGHLLRVKRVPDGSIHGVDHRGLAGDVDFHGLSSHLHGEHQSDGRIHH